jgi:hypothetical protein
MDPGDARAGAVGTPAAAHSLVPTVDLDPDAVLGMTTPAAPTGELLVTPTLARVALLELGAALVAADLVGYAVTAVGLTYLREERRTAPVSANVFGFALTRTVRATLLTGPTALVATRYLGLTAEALPGVLVALLPTAAAVMRTTRPTGIAALVGVADLVVETALIAPRANQVLLAAKQAVNFGG